MGRQSPFAAALALALLSSFAAAAPKPKVAAPRPARALAEELSGPSLVAYEQAKTLFEHGDFATAHAKFKQSFDSSQNPRLLWNMAACSAKQKRYALAIDEAERHLALGRASLSAEQIEKAHAFLAEVRGYVAEATFEVSPAGATLTVDREPRGLVSAAKPLNLDLGSHEITLEKQGFKPLRDAVVVREVGKATFTFTLEPSAAPAVAISPAVVAASTTSSPGPRAPEVPSRALEPVPASPSAWSGRNVAGWSLFGVGVAALGVGVFEHLEAKSAASDFNAKCQGKVCEVSAGADYDRAATAATAATALYAGGVVLAGVGAALLWAGGGEGEARAFVVSATPGGVRIAGEFR
jgi:tetratricopeptide (TPR) repeat protein